MPATYFIKVGGAEFGPVTIETLQEWKADGRIVPETEVAISPSRNWFPAENLSALFPDKEEASEHQEYYFPEPYLRRTQRSLESIQALELLLAGTSTPLPFGALLSRTLRLSLSGIATFLPPMLLVAAVSFLLSVASGWKQVATAANDSQAVTLATVCILPCFLLLLFLWPLCAGAVVAATRALVSGEKPVSALQLVRNYRGALFRTFFITQAIFLAWAAAIATVFSLPAIAAPALTEAMVALGLLAMLFVGTRLWVQFLFRNQAVLFEDLSGMDALRRSRALVQTPGNTPWCKRPAFQAGALYSVWICAAVLVGFVANLPAFTLLFKQILEGADIETITQLSATQALHPAMLLSDFMSSFGSALIQPFPLIGITLLYLNRTGKLPPE